MAPPASSTGSTPVTYTEAEKLVRQHPDVATLMTKDAVCSRLLSSPSIRIWAPAIASKPSSTSQPDTNGAARARALRIETGGLFAYTLNSHDTIDQFIIFWEESQPDLFPQSRVSRAGRGLGSTVKPENDPMGNFITAGEGETFALRMAESPEKRGVQQNPQPLHEIHAFAAVGEAVSGWAGVVHGGIVATLLDEVTGYMPMINQIRGVPLFSSGCMTGYLNTKYHRPVPTPGFLLISARITNIEGRKCWITGEVRSTSHGGFEGPVLASCEALFIALKTGKPVL